MAGTFGTRICFPPVNATLGTPPKSLPESVDADFLEKSFQSKRDVHQEAKHEWVRACVHLERVDMQSLRDSRRMRDLLQKHHKATNDWKNKFTKTNAKPEEVLEKKMTLAKKILTHRMMDDAKKKQNFKKIIFEVPDTAEKGTQTWPSDRLPTPQLSQAFLGKKKLPVSL
jgi:hypothetical protein